MRRPRVPGTYRGPRIADPVDCDLTCPSCGHAWVQPLIPAVHVRLDCPECHAALAIGQRPMPGVQHTRVLQTV